MKPNIIVCGPSGSGKSTSIRNLNPNKTIILNTEMKALPFRGSKKFKFNAKIPNMKKFHEMLDKALKMEDIKIIVIESFTSLSEHLSRDMNASYTGFDIWSNFKEEMGKILLKCKGTDKYIIFLGIDAVLEGTGGVEERFVKCDGAWKKNVEKEFVICLFTDFITQEDGTAEYRFITNKQKGFENCSAKSPMGMLPLTMDNDLLEVIKLAEAYENEEETPTKKEAKA